MQIIQLSRPPSAYLQWLCIFKNKKPKTIRTGQIRHLSNLTLLYILSIEFSDKCAILGSLWLNKEARPSAVCPQNARFGSWQNTKQQST